MFETFLTDTAHVSSDGQPAVICHSSFAIRFVTIGVYGWDVERFFAALTAAGVDTFCDLRDRRGVRGAAYVWANSQRLQQKLQVLGIRYQHRHELAPGKAIRAVQIAADKEARTAKRRRTTLSPAFADAYRRERLAGFDAGRFVAELGPDAHVVALFCVERDPAACHRSLLAERLERNLGVKVTHLTP